MHRPRTLRSRIFLWFVGAILLAIFTSAMVGLSTQPESITGAEAMARNVSARLSTSWDDPDACRAFVAEVRDVTGFEAHLVRDPRRLPPRVHAAQRRGAAIVPENASHIFIPVVREGQLLGAVEMEKFGPRPVNWPWWRLVLALALVGAVLSVMASRVANLLARPLEHLALAADRLGAGDLSSRAMVGGPRRWVAAEVRDVGVAFNRMAERVEALVRGQRELLGAISHELRSPLGRARVALEIARDRLTPPAPAAALDDAASGPETRTLASALDDVEVQLGAVDGILGDLLDVTRAGLSDLRRQTRPFVPWLRGQLAEEPRPPEVVIAVDPELEGTALSFDAPLLARAVHNLLRNARAHGHPDALPIEVHASRVGGALQVLVRDRGPGFSPGLAERAFEPFVRGDTARSRPTEGAGSGLGLTIVRRIVEAHGGRAFARNAAGGGAEVGFDLPAEPPSR